MSTNIFKNKAQAKNKNIKIMCLFILLILGMPFIFALLGTLLSWIVWRQQPTNLDFWWFLGSVVSIYVVLNSIRCYHNLQDSPFSIIDAFGARHMSEHLEHPLWKRCQNIVEEQAIAAQINIPSLYIFNHKQINALVVGTFKGMTAVLVSTGALEQLDREELAALIAHEYGHIVNGDLSSNLLGVAAVQSLSNLNDVAREFFSQDFRSIIIVIPLLILGSFGELSARFMQLWLCRSQEYLADMHAVQFTRNNHALAGVLAKALMQQNSYSDLFYRDHVLTKFAHMTFNRVSFSKRGVKKTSWTDTHPPLADRIERISPGFLRHFKLRPKDSHTNVDDHNDIFPDLNKKEISQKSDNSLRSVDILTTVLLSTETQEGFRELSFNQFINEQAIRNDSIDEKQLKNWEIELAKISQISLIDLRLRLISGIKKTTELSFLGQINLANIVCMLSGLIVVKNCNESVLTEVQLSNQLAHVLSAFAKLSHEDKAASQAAYVEAKESYPFIHQDKMPLDIIRLVYDLVLLSRLSAKDQQKLLGVVGKMIHEDGVVSPEEKSLSILLFRVLD